MNEKKTPPGWSLPLLISAAGILLIVLLLVSGSTPGVPKSPGTEPVPTGTPGPGTSVTIDASPQKYSPFMSSTVGIGLIPNTSGFAIADARYEWNASYGRFLDWRAPGYTVSEKGTSAVSDGEKIYWSFTTFPTDNPGPVIINVTARDKTSGAVLGRSALTLSWLQNFTVVQVGTIEKIA